MRRQFILFSIFLVLLTLITSTSVFAAETLPGDDEGGGGGGGGLSCSTDCTTASTGWSCSDSTSRTRDIGYCDPNTGTCKTTYELNTCGAQQSCFAQVGDDLCFLDIAKTCGDGDLDIYSINIAEQCDSGACCTSGCQSVLNDSLLITSLD